MNALAVVTFGSTVSKHHVASVIHSKMNRFRAAVAADMELSKRRMKRLCEGSVGWCASKRWLTVAQEHLARLEKGELPNQLTVRSYCECSPGEANEIIELLRKERGNYDKK